MIENFKKYKFTLIPSPPDPRDWKVKDVIKRKKYLGIIPAKLPVEIDYRDYLEKVRDQGNQGSCAAQAGSGMKEYQERIDVNLRGYLAPQFIYNMREGFPNSEGMYTRDLLDILRKYGICKEETFPYGTMSEPDDKARAEAKHYIIGGYAECDTIEDLKLALHTYGPCLIAFPVYNFTMRFWKKNAGNYLLGYHMVLVCGYTDIDLRFIIRNSWGDDWGDNGYTDMPYEDWGWQEEVWSTIDTDSDDFIPPGPKKKWYESWWILSGIGLLIVALYFLFKVIV